MGKGGGGDSLCTGVLITNVVSSLVSLVYLLSSVVVFIRSLVLIVETFFFFFNRN